MIRRYTLPEMGAIWSDAARFDAMLRVELAVARVQAARGLIPAEALAALESRSRVDVDRIAEIERTTDHDVIAFVSQVAEAVGPEGRFLHLGLTSSDVVDTALALQLRAAGERLVADADRLLASIVARARELQDTLMMGRTHSVHAEPTTLGLKLAGWPLRIPPRRRVRLAVAVDEIRTGQISGPVGTYSHLAPDIEADELASLGRCMPTRSARDRPARSRRRPSRCDGHPRRVAGASRRRSEPPAHGDRRGSGTVQAGPEGLLGDAPQAATRSCPSGSPASPAAPRLALGARG